MMDGCAFWSSKSDVPFTPIIKLGRTRINIYIFLLRLCLAGRKVILNFWNYWKD